MKKLIYLDYSECLHIVSKLDSKSPKDVELNASDDVVNFAIDGGGSTIYYVTRMTNSTQSQPQISLIR